MLHEVHTHTNTKNNKKQTHVGSYRKPGSVMSYALTPKPKGWHSDGRVHLRTLSGIADLDAISLTRLDTTRVSKKQSESAGYSSCICLYEE